MSTLVVGGAGYIGAHVVRRLISSSDSVVIADDLSTGVAARVNNVPLVRIDASSADSVDELVNIMRDHDVEAVVHLAAKKQVAESIALPIHYFRQNITGLVNLLEAMRRAEVDRLVFSSSAAVYGSPAEASQGPVSETVDPRPISPYGETKLIGEWLCADAARAWGLRWCALRYFNVVGAAADDLGDHDAQNLVPLVLEAISRGELPTVYGADYPTPDGTCVRDYTHVSDIADSHLAALSWLARGGSIASTSPVFNVGTGRGSSVYEVLAAIGAATGTQVSSVVSGRRPGDPASLVADVTRIGTTLGWRSRHTLADAVASAWTACRARTGRDA